MSHPLFDSSVIFTTTSGIHAVPMAEYVFMMLLAWFHRLPSLLEWQRRGQWASGAERHALFAGGELRGKTIGVVGYGSIGREVARLARAFGMRVLALQRGNDHHDRGFLLPGTGDPQGILPDRFYAPDELHSMLGESDVVLAALPLTPATQGIFDEQAFQAMKATAFFVNIARGALCDEAALLRVLAEKRIAGAALDVFQQEPLPPDSPFWKLPNVFISPHNAGLFPDYDEQAARVFEENLGRYLRGEALYNVVDKTHRY